MQPLYEVRTTFGSQKDAQVVGARLVGERLAACAQVVPGLTSIYTWEGQMRSDSEVLLILKTSEQVWPALRDRLAELHPYDTPEIIAMQVDQASFPYANWVRENTE